MVGEYPSRAAHLPLKKLKVLRLTFAKFLKKPVRVLALVVTVFLSVLILVLVSITVPGVVIILTVLVLFSVTVSSMVLLSVLVLVSVTVTVPSGLALGLVACFLCGGGLGLILRLIRSVVGLSQGKGRYHADHHDQGTDYGCFFHDFHLRSWVKWNRTGLYK